MRIFVLSILALAALCGSAAAQGFEGNWYCTDSTERSGLLTIYAQSYGFASRIFGDKASGTGGVTGYTDGVAFADGGLRIELGIEAGRLVTADAGGEQMRLESSSAVVMMCAPR